MIVSEWHDVVVASFRDAGMWVVFNPQTALRLSGVIEIKPLRGISVTEDATDVQSPDCTAFVRGY